MIAFTDADGDLFKVKVIGPGTAIVTLLDPDHDGNGAIDSLLLADTKTKSVLKISVTQAGAGDGRVDVGAITGAKIGSINALKANLTDAVDSVLLGDVRNGAHLHFGGAATQLTALTPGAVGDGTDISTSGQFLAITGASFISAAKIASLTSAGDFAGSVASL